jgi:hypothetical protein
MVYSFTIQALTKPLSIVYSSFMSAGRLPNAWLQHLRSKSGDASKSMLSSYRPILLTNVPCKIMGRIVSTELLSYLTEHKVISRYQHGSLSYKSTSKNLLEKLND